MPERGIDPVLVEKAIEAIAEATGGMVRPHIMRRAAEGSIRVVFDELGLEEERKDWRGDGVRLKQPLVRYVSDWRPVEQGDAQ